jgi:hypothetical protein
MTGADACPAPLEPVEGGGACAGVRGDAPSASATCGEACAIADWGGCTCADWTAAKTAAIEKICMCAMLVPRDLDPEKQHRRPVAPTRTDGGSARPTRGLRRSLGRER